MPPGKPCIRDWLVSVDPDLEIYAERFEEFGYNIKFLRDTDVKDLEQDLKDMSVKKVHCRVLLRHHSLLKDGPLPETPPTASTSTCTMPAAKDQKEESSHVKRLVPCISDIDQFQMPSSINGSIFLVFE